MLHSKSADSLAQLDGIREDKIGNAIEKSIILFSVKLKYVNVNTHLFSLSSFFCLVFSVTFMTFLPNYVEIEMHQIDNT